MEFHWSVRVTGMQGAAAKCFCRKSSIEIDAPISFDTEHPTSTSLEYFLCAVASDLICGFRRHARKNRVAVSNLEANLKCELDNPLRVLDVVGEVGSPAIKKISGQVYIESQATEVEIAAAWSKTLELSPLYQTLKSTVDFDVAWKVV